MADLQSFTIDQFNGGISDLSNRGVKGSFKFGFGLNLRSTSAALTCNQALKKDSGSTVTDLILFGVSGSDGNFYGFGDTGKIYKRTSGGTWTLEATDPDGKVWGATEFEHNNGSGSYVPHMVWATQTKLKKVVLSAGFGSIATVGTLFKGESGQWHTMITALGVLLYCDSDRLGILDYEAAFNNNALQLPGGIYAKALIDSADIVIIGASEKEKQRRGFLFTWDKIQDSWITKKDIQAQGVNSLNFLESGLLVQGGQELKYWDTVNLLPLKQVPGGGQSYPGAQSNYNGIAHFGIYGGTKNGVYGYGRRDKNSPIALNLEYLITPVASKATLALKEAAIASGNYEIGMVHNHQGTLLVSWKDNSGGSPVYGVDIIDTANKATAVYESLEFDAGSPYADKRFSPIKIVTKPLPANTSVEVYYRTNNAADWVQAKTDRKSTSMTGTGKTKEIFSIGGSGEIYEVKIVLNPSGNTAPEVLAIHNFFSIMGAM